MALDNGYLPGGRKLVRLWRHERQRVARERRVGPGEARAARPSAWTLGSGARGADARTFVPVPVSAATDNSLREPRGGSARRSRHMGGTLADASAGRRRRRRLLPTATTSSTWPSPIARSRDELGERLRQFAEKGVPEPEPRKLPNILTRRPGCQRQLAFIFGGQGPQWWAMGRQLIDREPVFRRRYRARSTPSFGSSVGGRCIDELRKTEPRSNIDDPAVTQPAIFTLQIGLTASGSVPGVRPSGRRAQLRRGRRGVRRRRALLRRSRAVIFNRGVMARDGPRRPHAGGRARRRQAADSRRRRGRFADRRVQQPDYRFAAADGRRRARRMSATARRRRRVLPLPAVPLRLPRRPWTAGRRARLLPRVRPAAGARRARLLDRVRRPRGRRHVRGRLLVAERAAARAARRRDRAPDRGFGFTTFVEIGPHPVLAASVSECLLDADRRGLVLPSLRRRDPTTRRCSARSGRSTPSGRTSPGRRCTRGAEPMAEFPRYPWDQMECWSDSEESRHLLNAVPAHPLLGVRDPGPHETWECEVNLAAIRYVGDHTINGDVIFPAAAYMDMLVAVGRDISARLRSMLNIGDTGRAVHRPGR